MSAGLFRAKKHADVDPDLDNDDDITFAKAEQMHGKSKGTMYSKSGGAKNLVTPVSQQAPPAPGAPVGTGDDASVSVQVFKTFKWNGTPTANHVLSHAPLVAPLQAMNLDPKQPMNVRKIYLQSASTTSKAPVGIQFKKVNDKDLDLQHHEGDHYTWSTTTLQPGSEVDYRHLNNGKGLLLHSNELSPVEKSNSRVSMQEIWKDVQQHEDYMKDGQPTHYVISANLGGYADPNKKTMAEKAASMNAAAQMVYANAKAQINDHPVIRQHMAGIDLHPVNKLDEHNTTFSDVDVRHDNTGKAKERFHLIVPASEFDHIAKVYEQQLNKSPKATNATAHTIEVFRPGQTDPKIEPGTKNTIGNIAGEGGVTTADAERAMTVATTAHLSLLYEIEHPGVIASAEHDGH